MNLARQSMGQTLDHLATVATLARAWGHSVWGHLVSYVVFVKHDFVLQHTSLAVMQKSTVELGRIEPNLGFSLQIDTSCFHFWIGTLPALVPRNKIASALLIFPPQLKGSSREAAPHS